MADFQWKESHIEWCLETFKNYAEELSAGDIEKRYRPKNGEPRKGKPKGDERTICMQDFRNLMRLMVINEFARATSSYSKSKNYRIRMISDSYPFIQEIIDKSLFEEKYTSLMILELDEFIDYFVHHPSGIFNNNLIESTTYSLMDNKWDFLMKRGLSYVRAFQAINYYGGDFDLVFNQMEIDYQMTPVDSIEYTYFKELFILEVKHFVALYKACVKGSDYFAQSLAIVKNDEYILTNVLFSQIFSSSLIAEFLRELDKKEDKLSKRTHSNNYPDIVRAFVDGVDLSIEHNPYIERVMNPSKETSYWGEMGLGTQLLQVLKTSDDIEIKKAVEDCETSFHNELKLKAKFLNTFR